MCEQQKVALSQPQGEMLRYCTNDFYNKFVSGMQSILNQEFLYIAAYQGMPAALKELERQFQKAHEQLSAPAFETAEPAGKIVRLIDPDLCPFLKRCIVEYRREHVRQVQVQMELATDVEILQKLDERIADLDMFQREQWFRECVPVRAPRLTDYVTMKRAEEIIAVQKRSLGKKTQIPEKLYDDKFGVLSPPSSLGPELAYWREQCELRDVGLAVAYFDIDNFKRDFNEPYTETVIDRNCLPVVHRAIEALVFYHGIAYHEGGDEFVVLLPNTYKDNAIDFMERMRTKLPTLTFTQVTAKATVSIGVCHVAAECFLTDADIRLAANQAKKHAKKQGGKNCIVTYSGDQYTADELTVVRPVQAVG